MTGENKSKLMSLFRIIYRRCLPTRLKRYLRDVVLLDIERKNDFRRAKHILSSSENITNEEKHLLEKVSLRVHRMDPMYVPGQASHYISVGLSARRCIHRALGSLQGRGGVRKVLDFACGYGRVLRFLKVMFPDSEITGAEIETAALDFCSQTFDVDIFASNKDIGVLSLPQRFDLIWCGSLITHIDEQAAVALLRFFYNHLSDQGACIFTTHGPLSAEWIQNKTMTYRLTETGQARILCDFQIRSYAYADYENQRGYGISVVSYPHMAELARNIGAWHEVLYCEHGWDNHQDVYAFAMNRLKSLHAAA